MRGTSQNQHACSAKRGQSVLIYFSLTVKAATLIFISGGGSAISSAKKGKSGLIYDFCKELISACIS